MSGFEGGDLIVDPIPIFLLLGPLLKNLLSYDYEVHLNMKFNPGNTASHFFLLLKVSIYFEIEKFLLGRVLSENN